MEEEIQRIRNIIKRNNILIDIYKNIECVSHQVAEMRLENIEMNKLLNQYIIFETPPNQ